MPGSIGFGATCGPSAPPDTAKLGERGTMAGIRLLGEMTANAGLNWSPALMSTRRISERRPVSSRVALIGSLHLLMRLLAVIITPHRCAGIKHEDTSTTKVE